MAFGVLFTVIAVVVFTSLVYLKSKGGTTATQAVTVGNVAPVVQSIIPSDVDGSGDLTAGFTIAEGTTKNMYFRGYVYDANGCADVSSLVIKTYRSSVTGGVDCTANANDCYKTTITSFGACDPDGVTLAFSGSAPIANYADPTDAGSPYSSSVWLSNAIAQDASSEYSAYKMSDFFEMNSTRAFSVSPTSLSYGSPARGADSTELEITFSNTGNVTADSKYKADDFVSDTAGYDNIPSTYTKISATASDGYAAKTAITNSFASALGFTIAQQTSGTVPTQKAYTLFRTPTIAQIAHLKGLYTDTLTLLASAP